MKKQILKFIQRGFIGAAFGPIVLAIIYWILGLTDTVESLSVNEVVLGIVSVSIMAFIAAGINIVYEIETLPLISKILIHGLGLYAAYAIAYLLNGWIDAGLIPFLVFTAIFVAGFAIIWLTVYLCIRKKTSEINKKLSSK